MLNQGVRVSGDRRVQSPGLAPRLRRAVSIDPEFAGRAGGTIPGISCEPATAHPWKASAAHSD